MRQRGFTLIELMVALAVTVVLMSTAVPSFLESTARARLQGAVNELAVDLQYARSQAVRERAAVALTVSADGASYTISDANATLKTVTLPRGVTLTAGAAVNFDALRSLSAATLFDATVSGLTGSLRVNTNVLGRVQTCSLSTALGGYPAC